MDRDDYLTAEQAKHIVLTDARKEDIKLQMRLIKKRAIRGFNFMYEEFEPPTWVSSKLLELGYKIEPVLNSNSVNIGYNIKW